MPESPTLLTPGRTEWVDVGRFVAMICIIWVHLPISEGMRGIAHVVFQGIWVQLFFLLAGYFGGKKEPGFKSDVKRSLSLWIPYFIWSALYLVVNLIPVMLDIWDSQGGTALLDFLIRRGFGLGGEPIYLPLWFLRDLALFSLFRTAIMKLPFWLKASLAAFLICFPMHLVVPLSWDYIIPSPTGIRCFCVGLLASCISLDTVRRTILSRPGAVLVVSALISVFQYYYPEHYGFVCVCLGMLALLAAGAYICDHFPKTARYLANLHKYIYFIYLSHVLVLTVIFKIIFPLGYTHPHDWFLLMVVAPLLFIIPICLYRFLEKFCPGALRYLASAK